MGLGDALLDSGAAHVAQLTDPRKCRIMHGSKVAWSEVWENNPRIARPDEQGDFQLIYGRDRVTNMRGYHTGKTAERWTYNLDFRPQVGEIYLTDEEKSFGAKYAGRIILEPHIKQGASPNKQWGWVRWNKLAWLAGPNYRLAQMGPRCDAEIPGVEFIETKSFRMAAAVIAGARAVVLPEGGLSHCAAALNVPGVVIFGGFTPVELTGYPMHRNLGASLDQACGMRTPCKHCADWMASIKPETVLNELKGILNGE